MRLGDFLICSSGSSRLSEASAGGTLRRGGTGGGAFVVEDDSASFSLVVDVAAALSLGATSMSSGSKDSSIGLPSAASRTVCRIAAPCTLLLVVAAKTARRWQAHFRYRDLTTAQQEILNAHSPAVEAFVLVVPSDDDVAIELNATCMLSVSLACGRRR